MTQLDKTLHFVCFAVSATFLALASSNTAIPLAVFLLVCSLAILGYLIYRGITNRKRLWIQPGESVDLVFPVPRNAELEKIEIGYIGDDGTEGVRVIEGQELARVLDGSQTNIEIGQTQPSR